MDTDDLARRGRVGIDGPDAAGKTTLGDALAPLTGLPRVRADGFLAPPAVRYARGDLDPGGYHADAFDPPALSAHTHRIAVLR